MKDIVYSDGPKLYGSDGTFLIQGHHGNELIYIDSEGRKNSIFVTGNTGSSIDGKGGEVGPQPIPVIAPMTLRFAFSQASTDPNILNTSIGTWTKIDNYPGYSNVWDFTCNNEEWWPRPFNSKLTTDFDPDIRVIEAGDMSGLIDVATLFEGCNSLTSVVPFDISNALNIYGMFHDCTALKYAPLFDLSNNNADDVSSMFSDCPNIESGMLDFYLQASASGKIRTFTYCFTNAGINTASGMAERAQIPVSWGGSADLGPA